MSTPRLDQVRQRFLDAGTNPSHFLWLVGGMCFHEASNGVIHAFVRSDDVVLFALEPLVPGAAQLQDQAYRAACDEAWKEFRAEHDPAAYAFLAVGDTYSEYLHSKGFITLKMGQEPWVRTAEALPTGNAGKGVRSARNRALNAGVVVEDWTEYVRGGHADKMILLRSVLNAWRAKHLFEVTGFLSTVDPFLFSDLRRYFVARSAHRIEGFLVASPIPARNAYFLEDMMLRYRAAHGTGELLTVEAMHILGKEGIERCSLGIVGMTSAEIDSKAELPRLVRAIFVGGPRLFRKVYNFDGLELFRKRFKPEYWIGVHLAVLNAKPGLSSGRMWFKLLFLTVRAFRVRAHLTLRGVVLLVTSPLARYPFTAAVALQQTMIFAFVNSWGTLPTHVLNRFAFIASAPLISWPMRSLASDFLYEDPAHFLRCAVPLFFVLAWTERTHGVKFLLSTFFITSVFDDLLNYSLLVMPFQSFRNDLFALLSNSKEVGSSLMLSFFVGLQICQFRKGRELLLIAVLLGAVLATVYGAMRHDWLVRNLNHTVFILFGFGLGKAAFEYDRYISRKVSKGKPVKPLQ